LLAGRQRKPAMSQAAKAPEPTMEEILASIRRIIADDEAAKGPTAPLKQLEVPSSEPVPFTSAVAPVMAVRAAAVPSSVPAQNNRGSEPKIDDDAKDEEPSDVLELTEAMQSRAPKFDTIEGPPDVVFSEAAEMDEPVTAPPPEKPRATTFGADRPLLSPRTISAVDTAFNSLAHTVLVQNARTLEDLVREMLKPMLKAWLDDNLPNMVERLVRTEIERVSRGRA
jgi:uncharacterized protein